MNVPYIWEHNHDDSLIYADPYIGAYVRGRNKEEALAKFDDEIRSYILWRDHTPFTGELTFEMAEDHSSSLDIRDADSDVIFLSERPPLSAEEYACLKSLAMRSAASFQKLFDSIPDKNRTCLTRRRTFYGEIPVTATEMYEHTKNVNSYYFGEIGIKAENGPDIYSCRADAFRTLESSADYLDNAVFDGSYGGQWSLRKVCRRFVWHDRIHAKAMWRMAAEVFGVDAAVNPFCFV